VCSNAEAELVAHAVREKPISAEIDIKLWSRGDAKEGKEMQHVDLRSSYRFQNVGSLTFE
jgi:hypothetical protein